MVIPDVVSFAIGLFISATPLSSFRPSPLANLPLYPLVVPTLEIPIDVATTPVFTPKSVFCLFGLRRKITYNGSIGVYDHDHMITLNHFDLDRYAGSWKVGRRIEINGTRRSSWYFDVMYTYSMSGYTQ